MKDGKNWFHNRVAVRKTNIYTKRQKNWGCFMPLDTFEPTDRKIDIQAERRTDKQKYVQLYQKM